MADTLVDARLGPSDATRFDSTKSVVMVGVGSGAGSEDLDGGLGWRVDAASSGRWVSLVGPGGLLADLTKKVLEAMLEGEMSDHVGYEPYDRAGHGSGNSRNGTRTKRVLTEIGPINLDVPRDRAGTFEPAVVPKRRRRLGGVDQMVLSLLSDRAFWGSR